jgi:hypothetical protein
VQRIASLRIEALLASHGQPMYGAAMRTDLQHLAHHFDERAMPRRGRYVETPDPGGRSLVHLATAMAAGATTLVLLERFHGRRHAC